MKEVQDEDEDEMFAEVLFDAKRHGGDNYHTREAAPSGAPPRTPPRTPRHSSSNLKVSPLAVPSMNKAARIVCRDNEAVDKEALHKAIERLKLMTQ
jgi:hypothetical protein